MSPPVFQLRQSQRDLTAMSGLAFIGLDLHRFAQIAQLDTQFPVRTGLPASAILAPYVGLLSEGKSVGADLELSRRADVRVTRRSPPQLQGLQAVGLLHRGSHEFRMRAPWAPVLRGTRRCILARDCEQTQDTWSVSKQCVRRPASNDVATVRRCADPDASADA